MGQVVLRIFASLLVGIIALIFLFFAMIIFRPAPPLPSSMALRNLRSEIMLAIHATHESTIDPAAFNDVGATHLCIVSEYRDPYAYLNIVFPNLGLPAEGKVDGIDDFALAFVRQGGAEGLGSAQLVYFPQRDVSANSSTGQCIGIAGSEIKITPSRDRPDEPRVPARLALRGSPLRSGPRM